MTKPVKLFRINQVVSFRSVLLTQFFVLRLFEFFLETQVIRHVWLLPSMRILPRSLIFALQEGRHSVGMIWSQLHGASPADCLSHLTIELEIKHKKSIIKKFSSHPDAVGRDFWIYFSLSNFLKYIYSKQVPTCQFFKFRIPTASVLKK